MVWWFKSWCCEMIWHGIILRYEGRGLYEQRGNSLKLLRSFWLTPKALVGSFYPVISHMFWAFSHFTAGIPIIFHWFSHHFWWKKRENVPLFRSKTGCALAFRSSTFEASGSSGRNPKDRVSETSTCICHESPKWRAERNAERKKSEKMERKLDSWRFKWCSAMQMDF